MLKGTRLANTKIEGGIFLSALYLRANIMKLLRLYYGHHDKPPEMLFQSFFPSYCVDWESIEDQISASPCG